MLIVLALIGGQTVKFLGVIVSKIVQVNISLPPLLGMLIVGIVLKNVPYNFGQFGRAECTKDHKNASFVDSINDLDSVEEHGSFKRSVSYDDIFDNLYNVQYSILYCGLYCLTYGVLCNVPYFILKFMPCGVLLAYMYGVLYVFFHGFMYDGLFVVFHIVL